MSLLEPERSLLLLIDVQGKLVHLVHRSEVLLAATQRLLQIASLFEVPVLVTEQYPAGLGRTDEALLASLSAHPGPTRVVEKDRFSCCGAAEFEAAFEELRGEVEPSQRQVVIGGIEAHICVVQTVVELIERGCGVFVCWECVSGRGAEYRHWALERMQQAGAVMTNHESVAFEWAGSKNHPQFRSLNRLLRGGQIETDGGC